MGNKSLIVVRGVAGSGKSSFCRENYMGHIWFEPDQIMTDCRGVYCYDPRTFPEAVRLCKKLVDTALSEGRGVIVSDVFLRENDIMPYYELSIHHKCAFKIINCLEYRGSTHSVPLWQIERMRESFETISQQSVLFKHVISNAA